MHIRSETENPGVVLYSLQDIRNQLRVGSQYVMQLEKQKVRLRLSGLYPHIVLFTEVRRPESRVSYSYWEVLKMLQRMELRRIEESKRKGEANAG